MTGKIGQVKAALKLRVPAEVKLKLEALAAERGATVSETVAELVALAYDDNAADLSRREVRALLATARRAAKGRTR